MRVDAFADRQPNVPLKIGFRISGECPSDHTLLEAFVAQSNSCTVRHDPGDGEISMFSSAPSCETKWSVGDRGAWLDHDRAHALIVTVVELQDGKPLLVEATDGSGLLNPTLEPQRLVRVEVPQ